MATVQSGPGGIYMFEDFLGAEVPVALTTHFENLGQFEVTGLNIDNAAAGLPLLTSSGNNGVGRLTTFTTEQDSIFVNTGIIFDVGDMGTIVAECRIKSETITTQQNYFGFCNVVAYDDTIEDHLIDTSTGTTVIDEITATHLVGFLRSSEITANAEWHAIWKGGTTAQTATTTAGELGVDMVAGDFQILRLEADNNGTVRWYIDGVLLKTLEGAISTSAALAISLAVDTHDSAKAEMDVDYILIKANRDWTV